MITGCIGRGTAALALAILLLDASWSCAQSSRWRYEEGDWVSFTDFRYVNSISVGYQFVYFGTTGGVTRYDRYLNAWETPYTMSDGLAENWIERVAYDSSTSYIWCQTRSGYIHYYHPTEKRWHTADAFPGHLIRPNETPMLYPDFFTEFEYTFLTEGRTAAIQDRNLRSFPVRRSVVDGWDMMWIGTWGLNAGMGDLRMQRLRLLRFGLIEPSVTAMVLDGPDIWFGGVGRLHTSQGITVLDTTNGNWTYYEARFTDGLGSANVTSMASDSGHVWFGTYNGLIRFDKKKTEWKTFTIFEGLSDNEITDLAVDSLTLWIGTAFGISSMNVKTGAMTRVENEALASSITYDIEVCQGTVWAATNHGMFVRRPETRAWELFVDQDDHLGGIVSEMAVNGGSIWFAALPSWAAAEHLFLKNQSEQLDTGKPTVAGSQTLPIAIYLSRFSPKKGTWRTSFPPGTFPLGIIYDLAANDSTVWIGTDQGVLKYDGPRDAWRRFTTDDGLVDDTVYALLLDGDYIWLGTPAGVTRFHWNDPYRLD